MISDKSEVARSNDFVDKLYDTIKPDGEKMRIALLTDFHVDFEYTPGASNVCD